MTDCERGRVAEMHCNAAHEVLVPSAQWNPIHGQDKWPYRAFKAFPYQVQDNQNTTITLLNNKGLVTPKDDSTHLLPG